MPTPHYQARTVEILEDKGYDAAVEDYPQFRTEKDVRKNHGPAWVRGYMRAVSHKEAEWEEEAAAEYAMEKAAERYWEEGPHGNMYDDPRGE